MHTFDYFVLKDYHVRLLNALKLNMDPPFGEPTDVFIPRELGWSKWEWSDVERTFAEVQKAVEVVMSAREMTPGVYFKENNEWYRG